MTFLSILVTLSTVGLFATSLPIVSHIQEKGNTGNTPFLPFLATFLNCTLWAKYGILQGETTIIVVNIIGILISGHSLRIYYQYTDKRSHLGKLMTYTILSVLLFLFYIKYDHTLTSLKILGFSASGMSIAMFGSPLSTMSDVIKAKSSSGMSFPLSLMSFIVSFLWATIGLKIRDNFVMIPNAMGMILAILQLIIFRKYRSTPLSR